MTGAGIFAQHRSNLPGKQQSYVLSFACVRVLKNVPSVHNKPPCWGHEKLSKIPPFGAQGFGHVECTTQSYLA